MRVCGLQCVTTTGLYKILLPSVESWDTMVFETSLKYAHSMYMYNNYL